MLHRLYLIPILAVLYCLPLPAQDFSFRVLALKGEAKANEKILEATDYIPDNTDIVLEDSAYLLLAAPGDQMVELVRKGRYNSRTLSHEHTLKIYPPARDYASRLIRFLQDTAKAVPLRPLACVRCLPPLCRALLPEHGYVMDSLLLLRWQLRPDVDPQKIMAYQISISNMEDSLLIEKKTPHKQLYINLQQKALLNQPHLIIRILPLGENDRNLESRQVDGNALSRLEGERLHALSTTCMQLQKASSSNLINLLIAALFFEQEALYADALRAYEEALRHAPQVRQYQQLYENFKVRNGLLP